MSNPDRILIPIEDVAQQHGANSKLVELLSNHPVITSVDRRFFHFKRHDMPTSRDDEEKITRQMLCETGLTMPELQAHSSSKDRSQALIEDLIAYATKDTMSDGIRRVIVLGTEFTDGSQAYTPCLANEGGEIQLWLIEFPDDIPRGTACLYRS